jgi:hypothetical protein
VKPKPATCEQGFAGGGENRYPQAIIHRLMVKAVHSSAHRLHHWANEKRRAKAMRNKEIYRNEIKSYIIRAGMTMSEAVEILADEYGWSSSVPNLSDKLKRGSLRYGEAVELADVLGYDIVWQKRQG